MATRPPPEARIYASGLGIQVDRVLLEKVADLIRRPRYRDAGAGFIETNYAGDGFYKQRGGFWNAATGRASTGVTKADVNDVRSRLRALGIRKTFDEVDALLIEAYHTSTREVVAQSAAFDRDLRAHWRAERKVRTARLRAAGLCIVCGTRPAPKGRSTCLTCSAAAAERNRRKKAP